MLFKSTGPQKLVPTDPTLMHLVPIVGSDVVQKIISVLEKMEKKRKQLQEKQKELMQLLQETQKQYKDNDPDEKVNELFKGDRRLMKNR